MRLHRPYIPWSVRRKVIARQMREAGLELDSAEKYSGSDERATRMMIGRLFAGERVQLNHDPALCNRLRWPFGGGWRYKPDANDPDHLAYMPVADHDIRTRVRGPHGQHSDLGLLRKRKRKERCKHPLHRLLEIRGSIMCGKCHKQVDRYGSPLHTKLIAYLERKHATKRRWPSRPFRKKGGPAGAAQSRVMLKGSGRSGERRSTGKST